MKLSRRLFLSSVCAAALGLSGSLAEAARHGISADSTIPQGWNTLPHGAGGLITGFDIAPDGSIVCRSDVGNIYRWTGTIANVDDPSQQWIPLITLDSVKQAGGAAPVWNNSVGAYDLVIAPTDSNCLSAIMTDNAGVATQSYVYVSTDKGDHWTKTSLFLLNADSNIAGSSGQNKQVPHKIAIDPINKNVVFVGMTRNNTGNASPLWRSENAFSGTPTFAAVSALTSVPTVNPGCAAIYFDPSFGTTVVNGQTVTARLIVPIAGIGVFESLDGGVTFTEIAAATLGTSIISVWSAGFTNTGIYYCNANGFVCRYKSGTFVSLSSQSGWSPTSPTYATNSPAGVILVDPRSGHDGYCSVTGPNGFGNGFSSSNADNATLSAIAWTGSTGNRNARNFASSFEPGWLNYYAGGSLAGGTVQNIGGACGLIGADGKFYWSGSQSIWHVDVAPIYIAAGLTMPSNSFARGTDMTVSQDVSRPPGAPYPVIASQDTLVNRGTLTSYPVKVYPVNSRGDCDCVAFSGADPSFMVAKINLEGQSPGLASSAQNWSSFSTNYGADDSWALFPTQPDDLYNAVVTGYIDNGAGSAGTTLTVTGITSGTVQLNQDITPAGANSPDFGLVTTFGTGTGGLGTYTTNISGLHGSAGSPISFSLFKATVAGDIAAVDSQHAICVPSGRQGGFVPVYTDDQGASWHFTDLPQADWTGRTFVFGFQAKVFACGYGADLGTVWGALANHTGNIAIYKSTNSGKTFGAAISTISVSATTHGAILYTVPGFPGELWVTAYFTGGTNVGLWHSTDGGLTWTRVPTALPLPTAFALGASIGASATPSGYPTLFVQSWNGSVPKTLHYSTDKGVTWNLVGATGTNADLPKVCQIGGIFSISGDWNVPLRIYACTGQQGFVWFNP